MTEARRIQRNQDKLAELHPAFRRRVAAVIRTLEEIGIRPRIQEGWRSPADQLAAFERGNSRLKFGFHNVTGPGGAREALAADLLDDDHPLAPAPAYLLHLAAAAGRQRLETGIRWGLPARLAAAIDAALNASDWNRPVKVGWDPTHLEPLGLSIAEARAGKRPA